MEALTLARPYARAAFEVARDAGALADWSGWLAVAASVADDARIAALRNDPRVEHEQLIALHLPQGCDADSAFGRFIAELVHYRRLALLPEIAALYDALKREAESVLKVKVTSAMSLDAAQTEQLKTALKRRFKRDIVIDAAVDPALLGGVVIDTGETVIDGSARGRLAQLAAALTH
jgi:F-type H+-transporting ATPase subunit delta